MAKKNKRRAVTESSPAGGAQRAPVVGGDAGFSAATAEAPRRSIESPTPSPRCWRGTGLTILAAVAFQYVLILLPLVGPAGAAAPHAHANALAWLGAWAVASALSAWALFVKYHYWKRMGGKFPRWTALLCFLCLFLIVSFLTGRLCDPGAPPALPPDVAGIDHASADA